MTHNQIDYQRLQEEKRANLAKERNAELVLAETNRHNVEYEKETHRTNLANESIKDSANVINQRHYERMDSETARNNMFNNQESQRTHLANEAISRSSVGAQYAQAAAAQASAAAAGLNAQANMLKATTDAEYAPLNYGLQEYTVRTLNPYKAESERMQAEASSERASAATTQADAAQSQAETAFLNWANNRYGNKLKADYNDLLGKHYETVDTSQVAENYANAISKSVDAATKIGNAVNWEQLGYSVRLLMSGL